MVLFLFSNVLFKFAPIINPEGVPWIVSVCHMSKHNECTIK